MDLILPERVAISVQEMRLVFVMLFRLVRRVQKVSDRNEGGSKSEGRRDCFQTTK